MHRARVLFLLGLSVSVPVAAADAYRIVEQWAAADGLPVETIAGMALDRELQLWIATYDGVVRYQGFDFRHYNRDSEPALPGNRLSSVLTVPDGGVILQFEDGRLGHLGNEDYQPVGQADADHVVAFAGQIWFISSDTRTLWAWRAGSEPEQRDATPLSAIAVDPFRNRLLLGTLDGRVLYLSAMTRQMQTLLEQDASAILGLASSPAGELLVIDQHRARTYADPDVAGIPLSVLELERMQQRPVRSTWTQRGWLLANLLTSAGAGPHLVHGSSLERLPVAEALGASADRSQSRIEQTDALGRRWINDGQQLIRDGQVVFSNGERIVDFVVDPFNQIWLAQPTRGLRLLKQIMIETLGNGPGELDDPNISMVTEHDGRILIGGWVELSQFDPATGAWTRLLERTVRDVLPDADGLLVGTAGLCRMEMPGHCEAVADFPVRDTEVLMLHREAGSAVWAGTASGLFLRDPDGRWRPDRVHPAIVRTALENASGRILFGTNGDGVLVHQSGNGAQSSVRGIGPEQGLASPYVRSLLAVPGGRALVGTEDAGLCLLSDALEVVSCLSTSEGLPHHSVHYMILDDLDRLWVNSNGGIYWVELGALLVFLERRTTTAPEFFRLGRRHGLRSVEGNGGVNRAGLRTADGRIWFPNQLGLVSIRPGAATYGLDHPLATRIRTVSPASDGTLHLPRHARHLELELTAIALAEPENVQFRYRFTSDSDWTEIGPRRHLHFRDLKPGRHRLEVSARHVNSPWLSDPEPLEFTAGYRLQEHPLVHALTVSVALLVLIGFWLAALHRQKRLEREIEDRSMRLDRATEQVSGLATSLQRIDAHHRTALHAVSRELKSALNAAMEPLLQNWGKPTKARESDITRTRAQTLSALIDQIGSFADPAQQGADEMIDDDVSPPAPAPRRGNGEDAPRPTADLMAQIRMEVLLHLADPDFSVDQLARRLGMSRSVLYRRVAESFESGPAELMRDLRLEEAAKLLRETDSQVSSIAYATGFSNVSALSRAFSRKMGVSPREWRRQSVR